MYNEIECQNALLYEQFPNQLKKSILQQTAIGKLVPQYQNDKPASVFLERIRAKKQQLIKEKKSKKISTNPSF